MPEMRRVVVYHDWYGCDTGCCGHRAKLYEGTKEIDEGEFQFAHCYSGDKEAFARRIAEKAFPGVPLDFPSCEISAD